jgi:MraZ protein
MLPSDFKEQLGEQAAEGFVLRPSLFDNKKCLDLFTLKDWDEQREKLRASIKPYDEIADEALHVVNRGVRPVKLDSSGRLQIPKELMDEGGLVKEVVVEALANKMEIWDKERYEKTMAALDKKKILEFLNSIM